MKKNYSENKGFTLLEILLVVAAIAILAGIVIVALNPGKQLGDTRNSERRSDINTILNAVYQYSIDNDGNFPTGLNTTTDAQVLGLDSSGCNTTCTAITTASSCLDMSDDLIPTYIVGIPSDPTSGSDDNTDYYIKRESSGRIVVGSCDPEQGATIEITR